MSYSQSVTVILLALLGITSGEERQPPTKKPSKKRLDKDYPQYGIPIALWAVFGVILAILVVTLICVCWAPSLRKRYQQFSLFLKRRKNPHRPFYESMESFDELEVNEQRHSSIHLHHKSASGSTHSVGVTKSGSTHSEKALK